MDAITLRPARLDDASAVADLRNAPWQAPTGRAITDAEQIRHDWQVPGFDVGRRVGVAVDSSGTAIGFVWVATRDVDSVGLILGGRDDAQGGAARELLLEWGETRAREVMAENGGHGPFPIYVRVAPGDDTTALALERRGYALYRLSVEMRIAMDAPPPAPEWPPGMTPTFLLPDRNEAAVHAAISEAFATNWEGDRVPSFEEWRDETLADVGYDPTLWVVAVADSGEVAGAMGGTAVWRGQEGVGGLFDFGVRPAWRRQGLGRAILLQALRRFYGRGYHTVALSVDAHNTPAVALYESVGMCPTLRIATYTRQVSPR